jgi:hypothetical protein
MKPNSKRDAGLNQPVDEKIGKALIFAGLKEMATHLDTCFLPLGFEQTKGPGTRKYVGEYNGRSLTVTFAVRTRTRYITSDISYRRYTGTVMDFEQTTGIMSRLSVVKSKGALRGVSKFVQGLYKNKPVTDLPAPYDSFAVWAHDPDWGRHLLSDADVITALQNSVLAADGATSAIILSPGKWQQTRSVVPAALSADVVAEWLEAFTAVATLAEKNPPMQEVAPTWLERQNTTTAAFIVAAGFLFGIPFLLFVCCMLPALLIIFLGQL